MPGEKPEHIRKLIIEGDSAKLSALGSRSHIGQGPEALARAQARELKRQELIADKRRQAEAALLAAREADQARHQDVLDELERVAMQGDKEYKLEIATIEKVHAHELAEAAAENARHYSLDEDGNVLPPEEADADESADEDAPEEPK